MSERGGWRAAADIGGTFTDLVLVDREGRCAAVAKLLTSADDPARSVTEGLDRLLADAGVDGQSLEVVVHGTTLVANALIERRGADTGLITPYRFGRRRSAKPALAGSIGAGRAKTVLMISLLSRPRS